MCFQPWCWPGPLCHWRDDQVAIGSRRLSNGLRLRRRVVVQAGPPGTNAQGFALTKILGSSETIPGNREDNANGQAQFNFCVQTNGVYNFRMVQEEGTGGARADWFWVNRTNRTLRTLVTPTLPVAVQLFSSATVAGTYAVEAAAVIDTVAKTATVARSGNTRFYKLSAASSLNITSITLSGSNVVLKYQ